MTNKNEKLQSDTWFIAYDDSVSQNTCDCIREAITKDLAYEFGISPSKIVRSTLLHPISQLDMVQFNSGELISNTAKEKVVSGQSSRRTHFEVGINRVQQCHDIICLSTDLDSEAGPTSIDKILKEDLERLHAPVDQAGKIEIIVAVLDTGIDPDLIPQEYLWKDESIILEKGSSNEDGITKGVHGRNFTVESTHSKFLDVTDDDTMYHGTMVAGFIIDQFKNSDYAVKIMVLKTHDSNGSGSMLNVIRAIRFAKSKKAVFINASWAFPVGDGAGFSCLANEITQMDVDKRAFFVSVAGNIDPNLPDIQDFFPAKFGKEITSRFKNLLIATTVSPEADEVAPTQNKSAQYVDLGVPADEVHEINGIRYFFFELPFKKKNGNGKILVSGSSVAAAIATGKLASGLSDEIRKTPQLRDKLKLISDMGDNFRIRYALGRHIIDGRVLVKDTLVTANQLA